MLQMFHQLKNLNRTAMSLPGSKPAKADKTHYGKDIIESKLVETHKDATPSESKPVKAHNDEDAAPSAPKLLGKGLEEEAYIDDSLNDVIENGLD